MSHILASINPMVTTENHGGEGVFLSSLSPLNTSYPLPNALTISIPPPVAPRVVTPRTSRT